MTFESIKTWCSNQLGRPYRRLVLISISLMLIYVAFRLWLFPALEETHVWLLAAITFTFGVNLFSYSTIFGREIKATRSRQICVGVLFLLLFLVIAIYLGLGITWALFCKGESIARNLFSSHYTILGIAFCLALVDWLLMRDSQLMKETFDKFDVPLVAALGITIILANYFMPHNEADSFVAGAHSIVAIFATLIFDPEVLRSVLKNSAA
jgi:hypothetical protein